MSKYTPGPWSVDSSCVIRSSTGEEVGRCMSGDYETAEGNARLMAAAPDLLAACEAFSELFRNSDMRPEDECHEVFAVVRRAIERAKEAI